MAPIQPDEAAAELFRILCGRGGAPLAEAETLQFWDAVLVAARRHGLAQLLFWRLTQPDSSTPSKQTPPPSRPPDEVRAALRTAYLHTLATNLRAHRQLAEIVASFNAGGITPILLKGAHLAFGVYPDPGLRPMCDFDLLVDRAEVPAAMKALAGLGYIPTRTFDLESEMALLHHAPAFSRPGSLFIEMHWALLRASEPYHIDTAALRTRARPAGMPGLEARVLAPADLLLHLCLHAAAADRLSGGLKPIVDIFEVLRLFQDTTAGNEAMKRAEEWGAGRCLSLMLSLCGDLLPGGLPADMRTKLHHGPVSGEILAEARSLVLNPQVGIREISSNLALALGSPPRRGMQEIVRGFFPSRTFLATMYGVNPRSARIWQCYPRRWIDLLRRYALPALKAIGGERRSVEETNRQQVEQSLVDWLSGTPPLTAGEIAKRRGARP